MKPGICAVCKCADDFACEGGCSWVEESHTLCSRCFDVAAAVVKLLPPMLRQGLRPDRTFAKALIRAARSVA